MTKNNLLTLLIEVARRQLTTEEQTELREALTPHAFRDANPKQNLALILEAGRARAYQESRTCNNCASSASGSPRCGLCTGPLTATTQWEPKT